MHISKLFFGIGTTLLLVGLSGCNTTNGTTVSAAQSQAVYTPPEASGLVGGAPYPTPADVCVVIGENELTSHYLDHTRILIGCPAHEAGAIEDRMAEGAIKVDQIGDWVLLSLPAGSFS